MNSLDVSMWATDIRDEVGYLIGDLEVAIIDRSNVATRCDLEDEQIGALVDQLDALKRALRSIDKCISYRRW